MSDTAGPVTAYLDLLKDCLTAAIYPESAWVSTASARGSALKLLHRLLGWRSLMLVQRRAFDPARREAGRDWPLFGYTMAGRKRLDNLQHCIEQILRRQVPGDLLEAGVWRGGSCIFMRCALDALGDRERRVFAADSFEGMPVPAGESDGWDYSNIDFLKVSLEQVKLNFGRFTTLDERTVFLKGWFADTLPTAPVERLALLRLDGDMYSSTMDTLTHLYDKLSPGGFVIVDDYLSWPACKRAVDEFLQARGLRPDILAIDWTAVYWQV